MDPQCQERTCYCTCVCSCAKHGGSYVLAEREENKHAESLSKSFNKYFLSNFLNSFIKLYYLSLIEIKCADKEEQTEHSEQKCCDQCANAE